jgi:hypothetical protein
LAQGSRRQGAEQNFPALVGDKLGSTEFFGLIDRKGRSAKVNLKLSVGREDRDGKTGFFTKQKSLGVAGTTFKLFCEVKRLDFPSNPALQLKIPG